MAYTYHPHHRVWKRDGYQGLAYSDGMQVETAILAVIEAATDLTSLSVELPSKAKNWPMEYHFSRQRHCLIRPLPIQPGDRVLELGCGCGAITRYLGEIGADVTAVEGSELRARSAASRCRDLPNVKVYVDDLTNAAFDTPFDWVLLIGVLEYSPVYVKTADPVATYFASARQHLKADGRMVVAIENKLGLKYWNGSSEDHVGARFYGINGLYGPGTPVTFGRKGLRDVFRNGGMSNVEFLYPYPDYKMPDVILADAALEQDPPIAANLLARTHARDYHSPKPRLFSEPMVVESLEENGLVGEFANSFLAIGHNRAEPCMSGRDCAWIYSINNRRPQFTCETKLSQAMSGSAPMDVVKRRLVGHQDDIQVAIGNLTMTHRVPKEDYQTGCIYTRRVNRAFLVAKSQDEVADALAPWFALAKHLSRCIDPSRPLELASWVIPGEHWDTIASNVVEDSDGFAVIDREWCIAQELPLSFVLVRGCVNIINGMLWQQLDGLDVNALIKGIAARLGLSVRDEELTVAREAEKAIQAAISIDVGFSAPRQPPVTLDRVVTHQEQQLLQAKRLLQEYDAQLSAMQTNAALGSVKMRA